MEQIQCAKCQAGTSSFLSLRCQHNLCLDCAASLLRRLMQVKRLLAVTNLTCELCGVLSALRPQSFQQLISTQRQPPQQPGPSLGEDKSLFCFTCATPCFSVDKLLEGGHRDHNVGNVIKCEAQARQLLEGLQEKIAVRLESVALEHGKLAQRKRTCLEELSKLKLSIREGFDRLRRKLDEKEGQLLKQGEETMDRQLSVLESATDEIKGLGSALQRHESQLRQLLRMSTPGEVAASLDYYSKQRSGVGERLAQVDGFRCDETVGRAGLVCLVDFDAIEQQLDCLKSTKLKVEELAMHQRSQDWQHKYFEQAKKTLHLRSSDSEASANSAFTQPKRLCFWREDSKFNNLGAILRSFRKGTSRSRLDDYSLLDERKSLTIRERGLDQRLRRLQRLID